MTATNEFQRARDALLRDRENYAAAYAGFHWPRLDTFNWAMDHFDRIAPTDTPALRLVSDAGDDRTLSFGDLSLRSRRLASYLSDAGLAPGDRIIVMLGNDAALWETLLGAMRLGAVVIPATPLLTRADLADRLERGAAGAIIVDAAFCSRFEGLRVPAIRVVVGGTAAGWRSYAEMDGASAEFEPTAVTHPAGRRVSRPVVRFHRPTHPGAHRSETGEGTLKRSKGALDGDQLDDRPFYCASR